MKPQAPTLELANVKAWAAWLKANHASSDAVFLRIEKKNASTLTYATALEAALRWGWIDGQKAALDDVAFLQRFSRRTAKSPWSKINRAKAEALIANGQMQPPGLAEVERAKADGRWARAYDSSKTATVPEDLAAALAKKPRARAFFDALDSANRFAILYRVTAVKRAETRSANIEKFVAMCAAGETLYPPKKAKKKSDA